jgi:hypothetical protein
MNRIFKYLQILGIVFALDVQAQDLYSGEVAISGPSAAERSQAVPSALIQVLQKHSGQRELPISPALDSALLEANRILVSFYYRDHEAIASDGARSTERRLVANFLPEAVDRIVQELELPRWRADRRPVQIWIVVDDGLGRRLMPVEYEYAWNALKDIANLRGLPLAWPELDEEQEQLVDLQLLWGGFTDELPDQGYGLDDVVIVAARREGAEWNVRWNFGDGDETSGWRIRDIDLSFALVDGLHHLTDVVANRDAIAVSGQGQWQSEISVSGFKSPEDYVDCLAYLEKLDVVETVNILEVRNELIRFRLELNALPEYFRNEIERDAMLLPGLSENEYVLGIRGSVVEQRGQE